jgi:DNA-binding response OmpR family regulator
MLVDDEEDIALLFKDGLERYGHYDVKIYFNPQEALDNFKHDVYDLILIDIIMPNMSGFEFYSLLKNKLYNSKVCFFSAADHMDDKIKNRFPELKEQKTVLIQKPIKLKELSNKIIEIINESNN